MASPEFSGHSSNEDSLSALRKLAANGYPLADTVIAFDYTHFGYSSTHFRELNARNRGRLPLGKVVGRLVTAQRYTTSPTIAMEHAAGVSLAILDEPVDGIEYPVPGIIKVSSHETPKDPDSYGVRADGSFYLKPEFLHEEPIELEIERQRELIAFIRKSFEQAQELRHYGSY